MVARLFIITNVFWFNKAESLRRCFSWRVGEALGVQALRPAKGAREGAEAPKGCEGGEALRMGNSGALVAL